jgi:GAF domain-containing protein
LQQEPSADIINQITLRAGFRARLVAPLIRGEDVIGLLVVAAARPAHSRKAPSI